MESSLCSQLVLLLDSIWNLLNSRWTYIIKAKEKKKTTKPHFPSLYPMLTGPQLVIVLLGPSSLPNAGIVLVGGSNNINKQRKPLEKIKPQAMNWSDTLKHAIQYI